MNSKYAGSMGYQRLIKTIKSIGGGGGDGELTADSVDSSHIINGSILSTDICNNTITGSNIAVGTITSSNILNGTILETDISNHAITFDKLAYNSVGNTRIINGAVTHEKLSSNCVQSHNIVDGTILGTDICGATITSSNIANETIVGDNIANDTIGLNKIEPFVGATLKKLLNPTGLITIYNKGSSTTWFIFKIYSKNDIGSYDLIYDYTPKLLPGETAYCYYINNKFDYGINPILRIRILYNNVNDYACLQGASLVYSSIAVDDSYFEFEDVFFDYNNMIFQVEQV